MTELGDGAVEGFDDEIIVAKKAISTVAATAMATSRKMPVLNKKPSFTYKTNRYFTFLVNSIGDNLRIHQNWTRRNL